MAGERNKVSVTVESTADQDVIFDLLADGSTWPDWSPIGSFRLAAEAPAGGEGVGAVRIFRSGPFTQYEEVVRVDAPNVFGYTLVKSKTLHVREYEVEVSLASEGDGTEITWAGSFVPLFPGTGGLWEGIIEKFYTQFAEGLARHAEQLAS